jgi:nucleoside-diphosphate-sugar epimerase
MKNAIRVKPQNRCVIVTGGCGFLGSYLCEHYLNKGYRVVAVDNFSTGRTENATYLREIAPPGRLQIVRADCSKKWLWVKKLNPSWLEDLELVLHFASPASPPLYQKLALETMWVNSIGVKEGLDLADRFKARLVFASTSEIYGDPQISPQVESYWGYVNSVGPRSCYDEAKRFGESLIYTSNLKNRTTHGFVRIFNTYGPRMNPTDGRVIINFLTQALQNRPLTIYGRGDQTRSFCYVDDLIAGITAYAGKKRLSEPVNLGNPKETSLLEVVRTLQKIHRKKELQLQFLPLPQDDPKHRCPDIRKAKKLLKWSPQVALLDGLQKMNDWLVETL